MTDRLKALTKRNQGREFDAVIREINAFLRGWLNYYGLASAKVWLTETEAWLRRRIRTKAKGYDAARRRVYLTTKGSRATAGPFVVGGGEVVLYHDSD